jgi:hypothetical protein
VTGCLSRWGGRLPSWVCALGGDRDPQQVSAGFQTLAGVVYEWRRSGLSFRDWLDSLR